MHHNYREETAVIPRPGQSLKMAKAQQKRSKYFWPAIALILGLIAGAIIFVASLAAGTSTLIKDSGVTACQTLLDNTSKPAAEKKPVTSHDFETSGYTDLKVAGTDFVATVKSNTDDEDLAGAVGAVSKLHTQYAILQTACANHGVNLPPLPA